MEFKKNKSFEPQTRLFPHIHKRDTFQLKKGLNIQIEIKISYSYNCFY